MKIFYNNTMYLWELYTGYADQIKIKDTREDINLLHSEESARYQ